MKAHQPTAKRMSAPIVRKAQGGTSALQMMADQSPASQKLAALQRMANARRPVQRMEEDELQMKPIQRMEEDELQGKFIQRAEAPKANNTGLPDNLKAGIENLSGMSMDHVKVHRNSDKPATVQAHAYAQGSDIHLGPGQEKHLPHEAWHVVQQAQGRVKPTMQLKGVAVNDDAGLETEADVMGAKASQMKTDEPLQRVVPPHGHGTKEVANTVYTARGGNDIPFDSSTHTRGQFSFGANTRYAVLERFNPQYAGGRIISVQDNNRRQVNVEGVQLDHQTSWSDIATAMDTHNQQLGTPWTEQTGYSKWDAKMYYNDVDNLVPALGALNAAAGDEGVGLEERIHPGLELYQGNVQSAWMNLQAGLTAVGVGISDEAAEHIAGLLGEISGQMHKTTEELF